MPPPLDPAAEPSAWAYPDSPSVFRPTTSSPRRVEDASAARWRGPTQLATSPPAHDVDASLRRNEIGGARTSGQPFDAATDRIARVADAGSRASAQPKAKASPLQGEGAVGAAPLAADPLPHAAPAAVLPARVSDVRDPAGSIWQEDAFRRDTWIVAVDGEPLPESPAILSRKRWLAERDTLAGRNAPLGLRLDAGERIDDIAADLAHFALIALSFPKFTDGRAFSTARLLREKHGYTGELRAVGNVLADQIPFMRRVGFDAFEVAHAPTRRALEEGRIPEVTLHYQPAGTRPWLRRSGG